MVRLACVHPFAAECPKDRPSTQASLDPVERERPKVFAMSLRVLPRPCSSRTRARSGLVIGAGYISNYR